MAAVTVNELFKIHAERLKLSWIAGRTGGIRNITSAEVHTETRKIVGDDLSTLETWWNASGEDLMPRKSLVGHLNLIHPNQIQVLGYFEVEYLAGLREISREDAIRQLLSHDPDCLIVAEAQKVPEELRQACEMEGTPLFSSSLSSNQLVDDLHYYLSNLLAEVVTLHGVYMEIMSIGVLLTGESGVGKSR